MGVSLGCYRTQTHSHMRIRTHTDTHTHTHTHTQTHTHTHTSNKKMHAPAQPSGKRQRRWKHRGTRNAKLPLLCCPQNSESLCPARQPVPRVSGFSLVVQGLGFIRLIPCECAQLAYLRQGLQGFGAWFKGLGLLQRQCVQLAYPVHKPQPPTGRHNRD